MKQVRLKINDLIDQHGATFGDCPGCSICTNVEALRNKLIQKPADRFAHILQKGEDMTKSDIAFLLENEVTRKTIRKSLNMGSNDFYGMLKNFGLLKKKPKGENEMAKITYEEYRDLKAQGMADKDIAEKKEMHPTYLSQMKKQWGISVPKERTKKSASQQTIKQDNMYSEYELLIADLKSKVEGHEIQIDKLEKVIDKYSKKEADYEAALSQKDDRIMELESSLEKAAEQIDFLNAACDDIENESAIEELDGLRAKVAMLEADIIPLRQLAYLKLKQDVGA